MNKRDEKVEDATIKFGCEEGDRIFNKILDDYPELDENDLRRSTIVLGLLTNAAAYLHINGWSVQSLVNEVFDHCEMASKWQDTDEDAE
ncbi:hypothetical protein UFOVP592_16 [uncultured Caudovirales phage]|uniref:Uncharacterized protein n=1 Tax=uncultured Caudovirales phage TaxID=2100421 RepID=A0A6J5MYD7_9CAUD|nr:hypothetical protein UFOVP592_16 [uncultured Caudovirales phage]